MIDVDLSHNTDVEPNVPLWLDSVNKTCLMYPYESYTAIHITEAVYNINNTMRFERARPQSVGLYIRSWCEDEFDNHIKDVRATLVPAYMMS